MRAIKALILSDGRPGHYHLSDGVVAAIARRRPVSTQWLEVKRTGWMPTRCAAALARSGLPAAMVLRLAYGIDATSLPPTDLVVSAGGETLAANALAARLLEADNIFCGSLRHLPAERFSLVISSYRRHQALPRHLVALKPNPIDPDELRQPIQSGTKAASGAHQVPRIAGLLIGGDSGRFHYAAAEWSQVFTFLADAQAVSGTRWIVSTSRRTDSGVVDALRVFAAAHENAILEVIDFRTAGPGSLSRLFARADAILATEDSSSMISEAVTMRLPVIGISPRQHSFTEDEREYRALLAENAWCRSIPIAELNPAAFLSALAEIAPLAGNHLDLLAAELSRRMPALFDNDH